MWTSRQQMNKQIALPVNFQETLFTLAKNTLGNSYFYTSFQEGGGRREGGGGSKDSGNFAKFYNFSYIVNR